MQSSTSSFRLLRIWFMLFSFLFVFDAQVFGSVFFSNSFQSQFVFHYSCTLDHGSQRILLPFFYLTITWGAAASTASVAMIVKAVKHRRHKRSNTMAANFQSASMAADSSSSFILSVIILISFRMRFSSLCRGWEGALSS